MYQFRPITIWPGQPTRTQRRSGFSAPWSATVQLLERELKYLGAKNVVLQAYVVEQQIRRDGMLYAQAQPSRPGVIVSFESKHGPLSYPCDTFTRWQCNVRAIALALESLRAVDRYGVTRRAEQYKGWQALPSPAAATVSPNDARARLRTFLGAETFDRLDIQEAIREALMRAHPDRGGDSETFKRVMDAVNSIRVETT